MMETIRVNMTPCEDVQTIHASQNDNEAREWGFELHNNGEKIDSSSISDQMVFKAYEGGTEQILPENASTPTTSPFKGDIKYPQGLLSDQEFLYRESPTEEDGLAKITDIKGNTLVWNQLANVGTLSATASYNGYLNIGTLSFVANHKYLIKYHQDNTMASNTRNTLQVRFATVGQTATENATANAHLSQGDYSWLFNSTYTDTNTIVRLWVVDNNVAVSYTNIMIFDLTKMGLDISSPSEFTSLFPLPYYNYTTGKLLPFGVNDLVSNGTFETTEGWGGQRCTITASNNVMTATITDSSGGQYVYSPIYNVKANHRYNVSFDLELSSASDLVEVRFYNPDTGLNIVSDFMSVTANTKTHLSTQMAPTVSGDVNSTTMMLYFKRASSTSDLLPVGTTAKVSNFKCIDLDSIGIKIVSKNQFDTSVVTTSYAGLTLNKSNGTIRAVYSGGSQYAGFNFYGAPVFTDTFVKGRYRFSFDVSGLETQWTVGLRQGASFIGGGQAIAFSNNGHHSFTIDTEANPNCYFSFARTGNMTTAFDITFSNIQLELGTTETSYTPFEEKTISLPISQYFPTGMKSAGSVYDELTPNKASERVGSMTLDGSQSASVSIVGSYTRLSVVHGASNVKYPNAQQESNYLPYIVSFAEESNHFYANDSQAILIMQSSVVGTTVDSFNSYLQSHPLTIYYELATKSETTFTTASLVTENAEIPLSNDDGVLIGKCTEQLSAEPGFHDAKIKLSDSDGDCYSNKIQLHIERSPQ